MTILVPLSLSAPNDFQLAVLNDSAAGGGLFVKENSLFCLCSLNYLSIRQNLFSRIISVTTELNRIFFLFLPKLSNDVEVRDFLPEFE